MKSITELLRSALGSARSDIERIDRRIAELTREREEIERRPPHTDDVVAWLGRGLDEYERLFLRRLGWYLNDANFAANPGSVISASTKAPAWLNLPPTKPGYTALAPVRDFNAESYKLEAPDVSFTAWAVAGLVRPRLRELAEQLAPGCRKGMPWSERKPKLDAIDRELAELREQRAALLDELEQARAVAGAGSAATAARGDDDA